MGIESFRRPGAAAPQQFEWFGDSLEPTVLTWQRLAYRLEMIGSLRKHLGEGIRGLAVAGSEMRADDDAIAPYQLSHAVSHMIAVASDALGTLELVLRDPTEGIRIPLFGVYPVARQALEAGAYGIWMIAPDNPRLRRTRALRIQVQESREEMSLITEFLKDRGTDDMPLKKKKARERQKQARRESRVDKIAVVAAAAGLPTTEVKKGVSSMRTLLDEVDAHRPAPIATTRAVWQYLSGLAHPSLLRAIQASDLDQSDTQDPQVQHVRMTAKEDMVLLGLDVALTVVGDLLDTAATRASNPAVRWRRDDLGLPPGWRLR
ncbi:hypothetical protein MZK47_06945 [Microbacterium aerolatum]|uniref:hypothetical protein n=1 Tax=Microbacterium aerolatum TaxID=153731 RepID=UPI002000B466|nr:hypothetical protein [Microbacterium aerolatum]MCK3769400.1 hypothetical protein [Microbacterium aerolatum]